jgi:hypothetical protein
LLQAVGGLRLKSEPVRARVLRANFKKERAPFNRSPEHRPCDNVFVVAAAAAAAAAAVACPVANQFTCAYIE